MKVSDLSQHLADLKRMLEVAGAKGMVITDLQAIAQGLAPFRDHSLADFAKFLVRAEAFSRGEVPVIEPKKAAAPKRTIEPTPDTAKLAHKAKDLYLHAYEASVTVEMVEDLIAKAGKLGKDDLITVAAATEMKVTKSASKPKILEQLKRRILDRKGSYQRAGLLDRGTSESNEVPDEERKGVGLE